MSHIIQLYFKYKITIFHSLIFATLICINLLISQLIRAKNIFFLPNFTPIGFSFGLLGSLAILLFVSFSLYFYSLFKKYPIFSVLILAGGWSNFIEIWLLYGNVADYISTPINYFNLADLEIWIGLIALNLQIWLSPESKQDGEDRKVMVNG